MLPLFPNAVVCGAEGPALPQGFTADFIRQCRYVPDSIGIILFFCASTMDKIAGCRGTLEKMCAFGMGIMMEVMSVRAAAGAVRPPAILARQPADGAGCAP